MEENDADPQKGGCRAAGDRFFFKSVVQAVLLFGAETLVVNPRMGRVLEGFQDQVAWCLTGRILQWKTDGKLE